MYEFRNAGGKPSAAGWVSVMRKSARALSGPSERET